MERIDSMEEIPLLSRYLQKVCDDERQGPPWLTMDGNNRNREIMVIFVRGGDNDGDGDDGSADNHGDGVDNGDSADGDIGVGDDAVE